MKKSLRVAFAAMLLHGVSLSTAQAVVKCQLVYTPDLPGAAPVKSQIKSMAALAGLPGKQSVTFAADGVVTGAAASIQPSTRLTGTSMINLGASLANGVSFGPNRTEDQIRSFNYQGELVTLVIERPPGRKSGSFIFPPAKLEMTPLKFTASSDFSQAAQAELKDKTIGKVELSCQDELR